MSLISSISGIRGTIGGASDEGLSPLAIVRFTAAFATLIQQESGSDSPTIVVGRDARLSGKMVEQLVVGTLTAKGCHVVKLGLATTPTCEMAVTGLHAQGGIIITASHNPKHWNALKLLGGKGEFLSREQGEKVLATAREEHYTFAPVESLGEVRAEDYLQRHIDAILALPMVDKAAITAANIGVAFDAVNSVGGLALPPLLEQLGVAHIVPIHAEPTGCFSHNPEPLPQHLGELSECVAGDPRLDVGFAVDPDVDRLSIVDEKGGFFGEEYTLVSIADYLLQQAPRGQRVVSNLSSTRALRDIADTHGAQYHAAAVGEVNVVETMKAQEALIGGEGNGGVIYPALHHGRDALVGMALFLTHLAKSRLKVSELRELYPRYIMLKERVELPPDTALSSILESVAQHYAAFNIDRRDGVKIDMPEGWLHIRGSNTEPIIRIYCEAPTETQAWEWVNDCQSLIQGFLSPLS